MTISVTIIKRKRRIEIYSNYGVKLFNVISLVALWALTLSRPLLPYGYSYKHPVPDRIKTPFVIFDIRALWRPGLSVRVSGCQKLQMPA